MNAYLRAVDISDISKITPREKAEVRPEVHFGEKGVILSNDNGAYKFYIPIELTYLGSKYCLLTIVADGLYPIDKDTTYKVSMCRKVHGMNHLNNDANTPLIYDSRLYFRGACYVKCS